MKPHKSWFALPASLVISISLAGCMEEAQISTGHQQGKYQGKTDGNPWDNAPLATGAGNGTWTKGDRTSWENHLRSRNNGQNEHTRIGH
jgi:hypothetical protein